MDVMSVNLWTALVSPFDSQGALDDMAFEKLMAHQIQAGVQGILLFGSTGEAATLSDSEKAHLTEKTHQLKDDAQLMIGITHNDTRALVEQAKKATQWGADVLLVAPPYYNKPTTQGILAHYHQLHESTSLPIVLYNVPSRVGVSLTSEIIKELSECPRVVGLKEASGNLLLASQAVQWGLTVYSGDDPLILPYMSLGAKGGISVLSNLFSSEFQRMVHLAGNGEYQAARDIAFLFTELYSKIFSESNPIGIKAALAHQGLIQNELRLPLLPMSAHNNALLEEALKTYEVTLI